MEKNVYLRRYSYAGNDFITLIFINNSLSTKICYPLIIFQQIVFYQISQAFSRQSRLNCTLAKWPLLRQGRRQVRHCRLSTIAMACSGTLAYCTLGTLYIGTSRSFCALVHNCTRLSLAQDRYQRPPDVQTTIVRFFPRAIVQGDKRRAIVGTLHY